uniref:Transporter (Extracellular solute binding protein family 5) n=1 Tax=uncultured bacterium contig00024 TaxID=1181513 RepID=A0A806JYL6_9BACT|nr:transporter (extracellular solute binding protein family 5) [uncultured bacterium contig00024]
MRRIFITIAFFISLITISCTKSEELSLEELNAMNAEGLAEILAKTVSKPWQGQEFLPGKLGGTWHTVMNDDPKSFNHLIAEQDSSTASVVRMTNDYLLDYDVIKREWIPRIATPEIIVNEKEGTLTVMYTLRNDLYWSYYNSDRRVKVTSDDVVFWYDEIEGDPACQSSGYYGQFLTMPDGSEKRVKIERIDDLRFAFHFPRIVAEPLLSTNMDFGPKFIYQPAKLQGGADGVRNIFSVAVDLSTIPSMGEWFIVEYTPGQRVVYKRNPNYWRKDANGVSLPYIEELIARIIPDENTKLLLFRNGEIEDYSLRPEDLDGLVNKSDGRYTVFNSEGGLSANFWTFNQNPVNENKPHYEWFTQKEFRQAMSCLLNHDRLNAQVYRGLAEPKLNVFPEPNPYYNPDIKLQYLYDTGRAVELLESIGIKKDFRGNMRDGKNRRIEFDLTIRSDSTMNQDIASIIRDELSKVGIKVNIRVLDFQKMVELLFSSFDWDSMLIGLSGSNIFPSQGSNVWPTSGNLHMWYPNQETPATEWEARIDYLYNEGKFTIDSVLAQNIWDEFQTILMEQVPMIYLMRSRGFWALNNRWDQTNVYFDNMNGAETNYIYLK